MIENFKKFRYKNKEEVISTQTPIKTTKGGPGRLGGLEDPRGLGNQVSRLAMQRSYEKLEQKGGQRTKNS